MLNKIKKTKKGFTLLEIIIALFIISVGMGGAMMIIPSLIIDFSISESRLTAAYLAQEGIEIVRNVRDGNWLQNEPWDQGFSVCNSGCEADHTYTNSPDPIFLACNAVVNPTGCTFLRINSTNGYNYTSGDNTKFKRLITITPQEEGIKVLVKVSWKDRGKNYDITVGDYLYDWYNQTGG